MKRDTSWFERLLLLQAFFTNSGNSNEVVVYLAEHSTERQFDEGEVLHRFGEPIEHLYLIYEGRVEMRMADIFRRSIESPGGAGFFAALAGLPNGHDTVALEPTVCLEVEFRMFRNLLEENFVMMRNMLRGMASQCLGEVKKLKAYPAVVDRVHPRIPSGELTLIDRIWLLQSLPLFQTAGVDGIAEIAADGVVETYETGDVVWRDGDLGDDMIVIFNGQLDCVSENGEVDFCMLPGEFGGGLSAFGNEPRWFTATAGKPTCLLRLPSHAILDVIEDNVAMGLSMAGLLAGFILTAQVLAQNPGMDPSSPSLSLVRDGV